MKKIIVLLIIVVVSISIYFYAYKGHRDIALEDSEFKISVIDLQKEFASNDSIATKKYADKTIETFGKISSIDTIGKGIVIDEKLFGTFKTVLPEGLKIGNSIKIKGRFLGYDELLEEFKIDQITIVK
ncbi:MAG: hypothetical protein H7239_12440 [Flavobacterium sp.]|nr:hypothetical protein [Flavobacterium sp.]